MIGTSRGFLQTLYDFRNAPEPDGFQRVVDGEDGATFIDRAEGLSVICSIAFEEDGRHWMHVSVARPDRMPTWEEYVRVKEAFVGVERFAYQVVPPRSEHVNIHPFCLHMFALVNDHRDKAVAIAGGEKGQALPDFTRGRRSL